MFDMFISAFSSACSMEALVANFIGVALGIVSPLATLFRLRRELARLKRAANDAQTGSSHD